MKYTIFLSIEPYLSQWLIHESGGEYPIKLKRGLAEATTETGGVYPAVPA